MRQCPIWPRTSSELVRLIDGRRSTERVFLNRRNEPITRYGIPRAGRAQRRPARRNTCPL